MLVVINKCTSCGSYADDLKNGICISCEINQADLLDETKDWTLDQNRDWTKEVGLWDEDFGSPLNEASSSALDIKEVSVDEEDYQHHQGCDCRYCDQWNDWD